jgi:N-sulfoglucosamine sulfohydrolase
MNSRVFLRSLGSLLLIFISLVPSFCTESELKSSSTNRPNILFCLADDWAWPHAGAYGDKVIQTPNFDRVAREGVLFTHAFSAAPSCTPSRAAMLTGQAPHRLEEGGNLHGFLPKKFEVYPNLLEKAGYAVGFSGKGWGPGNFQAGGRTRNPAGPGFKTFADFLKSVPADKPFCFWFGSHDPHRAYQKGSGVKSGMKLEDVFVPPYLPDTPEVRSDILDYYFAAQRFDHDVGELLTLLEASGKSENTLLVISGDNGWPFPHGKANLYDAGTRQPLAIRWPGKVKGGTTNEDFVNLTDLAPTFLEAAGLKPLPEMTGQNLRPLLEGKKQTGRDAVFVERERHANVRQGDLSYPARAIHTKEFLYIRNFRPDRWPAGDPEMYKAVGPFGDCDNGPSKEFILAHRAEPQFSRFFQLAFAKRPAEELYDLAKDPYQLRNVAAESEYAAEKKKLRRGLDDWMKSTADPRFSNDDDRWDRYPYFGGEKK